MGKSVLVHRCLFFPLSVNHNAICLDNTAEAFFPLGPQRKSKESEQRFEKFKEKIQEQGNKR